MKKWQIFNKWEPTSKWSSGMTKSPHVVVGEQKSEQ